MAHSRHCIRVTAGVCWIATDVSYVAYFVNTCRISHCGYFLPFLADSRFTLYAIATACLTGFPAFTSALMFLRNAALLGDLTRGTLAFLCRWRWLVHLGRANDLYRFGHFRCWRFNWHLNRWTSAAWACRTFACRNSFSGCFAEGSNAGAYAKVCICCAATRTVGWT